MKSNIHPKYYTKTHVKCSCGNEFEVPSTKEQIDIEVCSQCHPFYTGSDKGKMRGSQVEKFRERLSKQAKKHGGK